MTSRSQPLRVRVASLLLLAVAAGGCEPDANPSGGADRTADERQAVLAAESGPLTVVDGELMRTTWAVRDELYLPGKQEPETLSGPVQAPFTGTLSPAAVARPGDEDAIVYSSFLKKRPVLRLHDLGDDKDAVLDEGAYSPVWGDAGLAYFKGLASRVKDPARYLGHVVVRSRPKSKRVRWSAKPARYVPSAWAGARLIVHELKRTWPTLVVFDGPKQRRVLSRRAGLIALSPDGTRAFIAKEPRPSPTVAIVDVAGGRELASFSLADLRDPFRGEKINYVADSGAWTGETVVAAVTNGLAVFRVGDEGIELEQLLGVDPDAFPTGLTEPKSDDTGRYIVVSAELMQEPGAVFTRTSIMECDRIERRCVRGPSAPSFLPPRLIYNPSRP